MVSLSTVNTSIYDSMQISNFLWGKAVLSYNCIIIIILLCLGKHACPMVRGVRLHNYYSAILKAESIEVYRFEKFLSPYKEHE